MIPVKAILRNIQVPAKQANCLYKSQMLFFVKIFEVR